MNHTSSSLIRVLALLGVAATAGCPQTARIASLDAGSDARADADAEPESDAADGSVDATDSGTVDLYVEGSFEATNNASDARTAAAFDTRVTLHLMRGGSSIDDAVITVHGATQTATLVRVSGAFVGSLRDYDGSYTLDLTADHVTLTGIPLAGPAFHTFTAPMDGETLVSGTPLDVVWSPSGALGATIATENLPETVIPDTGSYTIPGSALVGEAGHLDADRVRVRRRALVTVPGLAPGSSVDFEVSNDVGLQIDAR
jgi:hypothetical protein